MRLRASFGALGVFLGLMLLDAGQDVRRLLRWSEPPEPDRFDMAQCGSSTKLVERINYYEFFGTKVSDADQSFRERLLVSSDHKGKLRRFAGQADWHIEWNTCLEAVGMGCRLAAVNSVVHVAYTLPRWADRNGASPMLQARWDRYSANLEAHEKGHGTVAMSVAGLLEKELVGLTDQEDCDKVRSEAARRVDAVMRKGETMQNEYDRITEHGSTQGAIFPF